MERNLHIEEEFSDYLEKYKRIIIKVAGAYSNSSENRKDLVQDIALQMWRAFPKYNRDLPFSTWTYRIALNVSISHLRKEKTRKGVQQSIHEQPELLHYENSVSNEKLDQLYTCIEELNPIDKGIVVMVLDGCKHREISSVMGLMESNISTRIQRIKSKLKICFDSKQLD